MKLYYPAVFIEHADGYTVEFPDLPGCITQGDTLEEAFEMAEDAACGWILTSIEDDEEIPKPTPMNRLTAEDGFVSYVAMDIDEYAKQYSTKSVKKTLTIPEWLNRLAEKAEINFSQELQHALKKKLGLTPTVSQGEMTTIIADSDSLASLISVISETFSQTGDKITMTAFTTNEVMPYQNHAYVN